MMVDHQHLVCALVLGLVVHHLPHYCYSLHLLHLLCVKNDVFCETLCDEVILEGLVVVALHH